MLTDNMDTIISNVAANIGRRYLIPKGVITVNWS